MGEKPVEESANEAQTTQQTTTTKIKTTATTKLIGGDGLEETTKNTKNTKAAKGDEGAKTRNKDWKKGLNINNTKKGTKIETKAESEAKTGTKIERSGKTEVKEEKATGGETSSIRKNMLKIN